MVNTGSCSSDGEGYPPDCLARASFGRFGSRLALAQGEGKMPLRKNRFLTWAITLWAILAGCLVTDLFVCPWTAVFP